MCFPLTSEPVSFFPLCRVQPFCFQVAVSLCNFSMFIAVLASLIWECVCRFIVGMERHSYPEFWILPGHGYIADGTRSLYTYLVASWHGIPSCWCNPFLKYTCKYLRNMPFFQFENINVQYCGYFDIHYVKYLLLILQLFWQALLSAIIKRIKGFIKLRIALGHLHAALPDATSEELRAYDDECAICRVCFFLLLFAF